MGITKTSRRKRRYNKSRMRKRSIEVAKRRGDDLSNPKTLRKVLQQGDYICVCSCSMCGNPRRWFKTRSLSEDRFNQYLKDY